MGVYRVGVLEVGVVWGLHDHRYHFEGVVWDVGGVRKW